MTKRWRPGVALAACLLAAGGAAPASAQPTAQELHFLYEVNRARHDPVSWAAERGVVELHVAPNRIVDAAPRPPLAFSEVLHDSARFKAEEMAANDYFAHQSQVGPDFLWPNELLRLFGYPLPTQLPNPDDPFSFFVLPDDGNQVESLAAGFGPGPSDFSQALNALVALIVDEGVVPPGHRTHLLGMTLLSQQYTEGAAGYGFDGSSQARNYWAFHTGVTVPASPFLTGVVFADANTNERFDPGEGLAGVTVTANGLATTTNAAGGWTLPAPDGAYDVTCAGGAFAGTGGTGGVVVAGANRQVDCVSGFAGAVVDFVPVPEPGGAAAALAALAALLARRWS